MHELWRKALGRRLKEVREERHLTQQGLAVVSGLSVGAISKIERGEVAPQGETIDKIAGGLDVEVAYLLPAREAIGYLLQAGADLPFPIGVGGNPESNGNFRTVAESLGSALAVAG